MKKIVLKLSGMGCTACANNIERALNKKDGIVEVSVSYALSKADVEYDEKKIKLSAIEETVKKAGYGVIHGDDEVQKPNPIPLAVAIVLAFILLYIAMGGMIGLPSPFESDVVNASVQLVLATAVAVIGRKFYVVGFRNLFKLMPNMDSLVAVGTASSYIYSFVNYIFLISGDGHAFHNLYFESVAIIIALIYLGKFLEGKSKDKTMAAIEALSALQPSVATVMRDGKEVKVSVKEITVGELIIVRGGESIALDGIVLSGSTEVDESMLSGESIPADKSIGDKVFGGTVNMSGTITYKVESGIKQGVLSKIIEKVEIAASSKAPIAKLADKISRIFVPGIIVIAIVAFAVWLLIGKDFAFSLKIFVAVLVIACPCSLGLATPTCVIVGTGVGAKNHILYKNAEVLQNTAKTDTVIFDKTGTLTKGDVKLAKFDVAFNGGMSLVASLEKLSGHPIGVAAAKYAEKENIELFNVEDYKALSGFGISGIVRGHTVKVGNAKFVKVPEERIAAGRHYAEIDGEYVGFIEVTDEVKENAKEVVVELKKRGVKTVLLSGDSTEMVKKVADSLGIEEYFGALTPEGKENKIAELKRSGKKTAFVGDGINDAIALKAADIGIAVGSGTEIAKESADIILPTSSLEGIIKAFDISKYTMRKIKQNLFWAFIYNAVGIPIACGALYGLGILLSPMIAGGCMALSSVSVVLNSLTINLKKF